MPPTAINPLVQSKRIKIHIAFPFVDGPYGGGNQFMKALRYQFQSTENYTSVPEEADAILFFSFNNWQRVLKLKKQFPEKIFIHRLDGITKLYNHRFDRRDNIAYLLNKLADASIFASDWSREAHLKMGLKQKKHQATILNAPNHKIFNTQNKIPFDTNRKTRLIASSWSRNWKKGFATYQWLDQNLDFSKYEMTFIGRSPIQFQNINHIAPLPSESIAEQLKQHDIFIFASENDTCSLSLLEPLFCGLPVIALDSGGNGQILQKGGELYNERGEIPHLLEAIVSNYDMYKNNISYTKINQIGKEYIQFLNLALQSDNPKKKISNVYSNYYFLLLQARISWIKTSNYLITKLLSMVNYD